MRKLSFAISILVLPFAFHSVQAQTAETKAGTSTVAGRVTLKGEPARGVMVILQAQNQVASNAPRARTDESGRFYFTGLQAGKYSVSALAPGYVSSEDSNFPGMRGKTLNLTDGDRVENVDLEIKRGGVITGRVTDSQGRPVIEERVNLIKFDADNRLRSAFNYSANYDMYNTDDRGLYRIYGLPEGRYLVSVGQAESFGSALVISRREFYPRVFYPNATSESEAKVIEVGEGSEAANIDITVSDSKQTYDVYGRVVDAGGGQPVAGVDVVLGAVTKEGRYAGGYAGSGARSGPNGEFRIFGVLPGKHAILARPGEPNGGFISDPVIVDIDENMVTGVEVRVRQGASISGVVVIEGTSDPKVRAKLPQIGLAAVVRPAGQGPQFPSRGFVRVDASGSFRLSGLQPGKAAISITQSSDTRGFVITRIERNGAPVDNGIEVEAGEQVTDVRVILVYGSLTIRGELRVVGGALPSGCRFFAAARRVDQAAQNPPGGEIDTRGQFVIENLPPGEYEIRIVPLSPDGQPLSQEIRRLISSVKGRVVLSGGGAPSIVLTLDLSRKEGDR
jgi:protocatechuate 3,4-dioxygenase beta subunit